jgi:hypothetical protein
VADRHRRLLRSGVSEERIREISRSYRLGVPGYLAAAAGAFVSVHITVGICLALLVVWVIVSRNT